MTNGERRRKHWGWGYEDEQPSLEELRSTTRYLADHLGFGGPQVESPVPLGAAQLPEPQLAPPAGALAEIAFTDPYERALHTWGRSYTDIVRAFRGRFEHAPDVVLRPRTEPELEAALEWALASGAAVVPFGGGTSVVGGITPPREQPAVTIDVRGLGGLLELDDTSLAARIGAGASGPELEAALGRHGLTMRHYPQSFGLSTLGGWIATRAGGHFATLYTHVDDLVESVRALTPAGWWESRRLPGSGAGISPDRMLIGSEGILGIITSAWVRVRRRHRFRASAAVRFKSFTDGAEAARALSQSGLFPSNCRLIDSREAALTGAGDGAHALLVLGFESASHDVTPWMDRALGVCAEHGGRWDPAHRPGAADATESWREAFIRAPYLRDTFIAMGVLSETFETSITWERLPAFHAAVSAATAEAVRVVCGAGTVTCRFTHVYPDGPAPYYTVLAPVRRGGELEAWAAIKAASADAIIAAGGTITHHHAVGREHRRWYDLQRPDPFAIALRAAKAALDPGGALNPGVLIDP